jgi:aldehyde dehydrogenase (NAD+)
MGPSTLLYTRREPLGVVGLITPWNFPVAIPLWKAAPALIYGNTVILKPSEHSPATACLLAEVLTSGGAPPGVFNVVHGRGAGAELARHRDVTAVSFTGSTAAGRSVAAACVARGAKFQLEMGGQNPAVVLGDADLEQAAALILSGAFRSAGEKCTATSRVILEAAVPDAFIDRLVDAARALKVGPASDEEAYLGPLISAAAREKVLVQIGQAVAEGARVRCGGKAPDDPALRAGHYLAPTILDQVRPGTTAAREEIFGPVVAIMRARGLDEAIALANDVEYGLSAAIFTRDLNAAMEFARRAEAGMVRVNGETAGVEPQAPFGGMKGSASFSREQGQAARDFYTQTKTISIDPAVSPPR